MGLLDDAIREHLDLKRRSGADPSEVERAEREALGPVRREPEGIAVDHEAVDDVDLELEDELTYADGETGWNEDGKHEPEALPAESPPEQVEAAHGIGAQQRPESLRSEPFEHGDETAEYDVEGALEKEKGKGKERADVLEETPDFLHDTPDHDRLWFEQKPPRDFDFDG